VVVVVVPGPAVVVLDVVVGQGHSVVVVVVVGSAVVVVVVLAHVLAYSDHCSSYSCQVQVQKPAQGFGGAGGRVVVVV